MLVLRNEVRLVETVEDLQIVADAGAVGCDDLVQDFETNSFDRRRGGDNPWAGDRIAGQALTWDDHPIAYYAPVRHTDARWNLPLEPWQRFLKDVTTRCRVWTNQNVKFDCHFATEDGAEFQGELYCVMTMAKMIDSDRSYGRGTYALDSMAHDLLEYDIDEHEQSVKAYLEGMRPKSKNYADVPADILGAYAGVDAITARDLKRYQLKKHDEYCAEHPQFDVMWRIEQMLTPVLYDMERAGVRADEMELKQKEFQLLTWLMMKQEELAEITGFSFDPSNTKDCYELLVNRWGLDVLAWTDDKRADADHNPSFDYDALVSYLKHPVVQGSEKMTSVVREMMAYRDRNTLLNFFVKPFQTHLRGGFMHPQYNQLVRTGRMSAKRPNSQQNNFESKLLIHPDSPDSAFLSCDASQIEFRLIVDYAQEIAILAAYAMDPDTDFHEWVAKMCEIDRDPAKTVNFCIGYGGGKKKVLSLLANNMQLVGSLGHVVDDLIARGQIGADQYQAAFQSLCWARAEQVYETYHRTLPGIKRVTKRAAMLVKQTGYVFNRLGRRRNLPERASFRALNSITQGLASDLIKCGMVALSPRYCEWTRREGISLRINVHDELVFHGPRETMRDHRIVAPLLTALETPLTPMRVPIRFNCGWSDASWAECGKNIDKSKKPAMIVPRPIVRAGMYREREVLSEPISERELLVNSA